jgi:uncharacterized Zn finger protein
MTLSTSDVEILTKSIQKEWKSPIGDKAKAYLDQFFDRTRSGTKIVAKVVGNHGTYTVSIQVLPDLRLTSACSCYIGGRGFCHHCAALAKTFLTSPESFDEKIAKKLEDLQGLNELTEYLESVTLDNLIAQLKEKGITQKAFAASIGMSTQHLSAVKSSELQNRFYHELGATKLACLWVLEHYADIEKEK